MKKRAGERLQEQVDALRQMSTFSGEIKKIVDYLMK
jgi:hypothetical protein